MKLADRMSRLGTETAFEVLAQVNRLRAEGADIVSFAIGEPDFPTPAHIVEAGAEALKAGQTKYCNSAGLPETREAIARYITETRGVVTSADQIVVMPGAKPGLFAAIVACLNPGTEALYPNPGFPIYSSVIEFAGAIGVPVPLTEERQFRFDPAELERLVTPKTRLVILNSPHNPCGSVLSREDVEAVAEIALRHSLWILSDEVYSRILYSGRFESPYALPGMAQRTLIVDGFSKTYSMTGWRLGFVVAPQEVAEQLTTFVINTVSCTAPFTQVAGRVALEASQEPSERMVAEFQRRRDAIVDGLNRIPGIHCLRPEGAFYAYPNVTELCRKLELTDAEELQQFLLHEAHVATLSRTCFGPRNRGESDEYLRFSYATSLEKIQEGLDRIDRAVGQGRSRPVTSVSQTPPKTAEAVSVSSLQAKPGIGSLNSMETLQGMVRALSDPDFEVVESTADAFCRADPALAVEVLRAAARDPTTWKGAARALSKIATPEAAEVLGEALAAGDETTQLTAIQALTDLGAVAAPALIRALDYPTAAVRSRAAMALGRAKAKQGLEALLRACSDEEWFVRLEAVLALAALKENAAVPVLVALLSDSEDAVKQAIPVALGEIGTPDAVEALRQAVENGDETVAWIARWQLQEMGVE